MVTVTIICEGQTEEYFVKNLIAPALCPRTIFAKPFIIPTSASARGGDLTFERFKRSARGMLRDPKIDYLTSLIDLYALRTDFPDFEVTKSIRDPLKRVAALEKALHMSIIADTGCRADRFLPHIQPHEFEGLLFSDVNALVALENDWSRSLPRLQADRDAFDSPEHINDGKATAPSKRLEKHLVSPKYRKTLHGPLAAKSMGLNLIEAECAHFAAWMNRLRALAR